jgi:argininosuccinate synthase
MKPKAVLAFSGGLDTTYCAVWLREQGYDVHAVAVQTGGFDERELASMESRSRELGLAELRVIDARRELFGNCLRYLIFANAMRGDVYPLCVSAERTEQARCCAEYGVKIGAVVIAHGSTGAGNDQFRFDGAFRIFAPGLEILTPIRSQQLTRAEETDYLARHGIEIPAKTSHYSVNRGMWGATIGGKETHRSDAVLPDEAYVLTANPAQWPAEPEELAIRFERGVPIEIDDAESDPVALIEKLNARAGGHGVGRGMHVGDTILGIKGRVAFEAPAATVLIAAHRELEKLVLSRGQQFWKRTLGELYGASLHEARFFDPLMRDLEAFLESSQQRVSGTVRVRLHRGAATVLGATSRFSLMNAAGAAYGEEHSGWNGQEAAAFTKLYGLQDALLQRASQGEVFNAGVA